MPFRQGRAVLIGGYARKDTADTETLQLLTPDNGASFGWSPVGGLALMNPTFGTFDPSRNTLYTSHSGQNYLSAVAVDLAAGALRLLGTAPTGSVNPAHLALSPHQNFVLAAGFTSGHVSVIEILGNGALGRLVAAMQIHTPTGPLEAQSGSQPHQIVFSPDRGHVLVPDRGCDVIHVFHFDDETGELEPRSRTRMRPGAGPRHLVFNPVHPHLAYAVNELDSTVSVLGWDAATERLTTAGVWSTLPPTYFGSNSGGAIDISADGHFLYVSNRGHDSVAHFDIVHGGEGLYPRDWTPVRGRTPRFLCLDPAGGELWVAVQDSHLVQRFTVSRMTGDLTLSGMLPFHAPACVTFA